MSTYNIIMLLKVNSTQHCFCTIFTFQILIQMHTTIMLDFNGDPESYIHAYLYITVKRVSIDKRVLSFEIPLQKQIERILV